MLRAVRSLEVDLNALNPELEGPKMGYGSLKQTIYNGSLINDLAQLTETRITRLSNDLVSAVKLTI